MKNEKKDSSGRGTFDLRYKVIAIAQIVLLMGLVFGVPALVIYLNPQLWGCFQSVDAFEAFMNQHQEWSILWYLLCQIVQTIVCVLPGQVIQIAGGFFYGFLQALCLSLAGIAIGSTAAFFLARKLGQRPMTLIFGEERFTKYIRLLETKKALKILLLLYLIPGVPKDMLSYAAGVSRIRYTLFMVISLLGRIPAMAASLLMGIFLYEENYTGAAVLAAGVAAVLVILFLNRKKLMKL